MYNFTIDKAKENSFFSFKISTPLRSDMTQQEWKSKQNIVVILNNLTGKITDAYMKILSARLVNQVAVVINIIDENPTSFSYDTDKICFIDRELLICLLLYRIGRIKLRGIQNDFFLIDSDSDNLSRRFFIP